MSAVKPIPHLPHNAIDRFWSLVDVRDAESCWNWRGGFSTKKPYGVFSFKSRGFAAHRIAYSLAKGRLGSLVVRHRCDNTKCCNPNHLIRGTQQRNVIDCVIHGAGVRTQKLSASDVDHIIALKTHSHRELAEMFNVRPGTIYDIRVGKTWSYRTGIHRTSSPPRKSAA